MMVLLLILLLLVELGLLAASAWYVPTRLSELLWPAGKKPMRIGWALVVVLGLVGLVAAATPPSRLIGAFYVVSGLLFMTHVYLLFGLLLQHLLGRFVGRGLAVQGWSVVGIAVLAVTAGVVGSRMLDVKTKRIDVPAFAGKDLKVMHITDVHLGHHRGKAYLERIVAETNRLAPDFVVITGDLVDGNVALTDDTLDPLRDFEAPAYFVTGNHETYIDFERTLKMIAARNVRVLRNEVVETHGILLVGLDYMSADSETFDMHPVGDRTIENELPKLNLDANKPILLLHHSPVGLEYVEKAGADLMLAGHTHGGQVFPGTIFADAIFRVNRGLVDFGNTRVFVSPGAGTYGPMMRLGTANVIHLLQL